MGQRCRLYRLAGDKVANVCGWDIDLKRVKFMFNIEASDTACFVYDSYAIAVGVEAGGFAIYSDRKQPRLRLKPAHPDCPCYLNTVRCNRAGTLVCVDLARDKNDLFGMLIDLTSDQFAIIPSYPAPYLRRLQQVPCYIAWSDKPCELIVPDIGPYCPIDDLNVANVTDLAWHPFSRADDVSRDGTLGDHRDS